MPGEGRQPSDPFTFTNESDTTEVSFGIWRLPEGATEDDIQSTGLDRLTGGDTLIVRGIGPIGEPWSDSATFQTAGQFAAGCVDFSEGPLRTTDYLAVTVRLSV